MSEFYSKFRLWYGITLTLYALLLMLLSYWNLQRSNGINWVIFTIQVLPLLAFLPGILHRHYRVFSWLCFILLFYFINAVMASFSSIATILDYLFLSITVLLFTSSMLCGRYAQRLQKGL